MTLTVPGSGPAGGPTPPPPSPPPGPTPAPVATRPVTPPAKQAFSLTQDLPPADTGLPAYPVLDQAPFWDVAQAAWHQQTIGDPVLDTLADRRQTALLDIFDRLDPEVQQRIRAGTDPITGWATWGDRVLGEAGAAARANPGAWGAVPYLTPDALDQHVREQMRKEYLDAQAVLDRPGGTAAEFLGGGARALLSPTNLVATVAAAAGPEASAAWAVVVREAAANALAEAMDAGGKNMTFAQVDLPQQSVVGRAAMGAVLGGGLVAAVKGLPLAAQKLGAMAAGRARSAEALTPPGSSALPATIGIDAAEARLRGEQGPAAVLAERKPEKFDLQPYAVDGGLRPDALTGMDGDFRAALETMFAAAPPEIRAELQIKSGFRSNDVQARLWADALRKYGSAEKARRWVAPPGHSQHNAGFAADLGFTSPEARAWVHANAEKFGLVFPLGNEPWHVELQGARGRKVSGASFAEPSADMPIFGTSRGVTREGEVLVADSYRIPVSYEVVDASTLTRASGDLQPRDRSRIASDAWIADTAARLDPAQLMPAPTADRGAPIVGPDNIVESGNGRLAAINRAYDRHPDRVQIYRKAIEDQGYVIPEGVDRPVLIARRQGSMTEAERIQFARDAQDSGVAVMTPTELAQGTAATLDAQTLARFNPAAKLGDAENADFARSVLARLPRSARNAMFDAGGALNSFGRRQIREALFARAWPARDMIELYTEGEPGLLRSLMDALEAAAPDWAALHADIERGLVAPEMDISPYVMDAMRLISTARAAPQANKVLAELLDTPDLVEGAMSPLTAALVRKFWPAGRAAPAEDVADFLSRYARDARLAGQTGGLFGTGRPQEVLAALDPKAFGDLPEDLGSPRGFQPDDVPQVQPQSLAYDAGAAAPEAEAADQAAFDLFAGRPPAEGKSPPAAKSEAVAGAADQVLQSLSLGGDPVLVDMAQLGRDEARKLWDGLKAAQPYRDAESLQRAAVVNHKALNEAAAAVAQDLGLAFKAAPVKEMARVVEKVNDKYAGDFSKITDVARTGVTAGTIEQADAFAAGLAKRFHILDEGWSVTDAGYFDRKLTVRFEDGQLGEVQIWPPGMLAAKKDGGHDLYKVSRDLTQPDNLRTEAVQKMRALYGAVREGLDPSFAQKLGFDAPRAASSASASAGDNSLARSSAATSRAMAAEGSAGSQPLAPDQILAPAGDTAQRSDASAKNVMEGVLSTSDAQNIGAEGAPVNAADLRAQLGAAADMTITLPGLGEVSLRDMLDDLDADRQTVAALQACALGKGPGHG